MYLQEYSLCQVFLLTISGTPKGMARAAFLYCWSPLTRLSLAIHQQLSIASSGYCPFLSYFALKSPRKNLLWALTNMSEGGGEHKRVKMQEIKT